MPINSLGEGATGIGRGEIRHAVAVEVRGPGCPEAQQKGNGLHLGYVQRWRAGYAQQKSIVAGLGSADQK